MTQLIKIFNWIVFVLFAVAGIYLFFNFFEGTATEEIYQILNQANLWVIAPAFIVSVLVYYFRTLRWNLLLRSAGENPQFITTLIATSYAYGISFFIPRLGEVFRCTWQKEKAQIPLAISLGTVVIERLVDILMLLFVIFLAIITQYQTVHQFFYNNVWKPLIINKSQWLLNNQLLVFFMILFLLLMFGWIVLRIRKHKHFKKFMAGIQSIALLKNKFLFLLYTLFIWIGYYLLSYIWFFMFDATAQLNIFAGITICAIGTIGRSIPISGGGIGAYHFLVGAALNLYGVSSEYGKVLATVIHGGQTIFTFIMCAFGMIYLIINSKKNSLIKE